ncbi:Tim44 domain-containing protein [Pseudomonas sp.]|uniref:Tim44 domain-containing protein n=1 Tax=Pseudomonas sp. TaxID=306 RepID=UPI002607A3D3|nr:Tim44 domain-containing protein [Pseudomonas sp.]
MQRFLSIVMVLCIGLTMSLDANARFGGGKSFGSAPSHQTRQAAPSSSPSAAPGAAAASPAGGASRWLGPLAGIAAGGLLASMFMGGGFHGMQFFDILIMAVIAFVIFRFIAARRRKQQPDMAAAGHTPFQRETTEQSAQAPMFGGSSGGAAPSPAIHAPAWFNESNFLDAARGHFQSLQQHWDANEMDKIAEFVTPQMLQFLKQERASLGDGFQSTYIDNLAVQLDGLDDRSDKTVATLTFSGLSKTSRFDKGEVFSESWNMERPQGDNQPWLVAGIRQNG